jgi:hypothetical protein
LSGLPVGTPGACGPHFPVVGKVQMYRGGVGAGVGATQIGVQ